MLPLRPRRTLGLAMAERSIVAAELRAAGGRTELKRAAQFDFPEELSLQEPERLGKALRRFLRRNRFSAKRAVIGIPARWLMVKQKSIPPASAESVADILRIQAERDFSLDPGDLALDCTGAGGSVLLVATLRRELHRIAAMAQAAGLSVRSITSSAMALASAAARSQSSPGLMLYLGADGAELTVRSGARFRLLRHLQVAPPARSEAGPGGADSWAAMLADEVRRVVSLLPGGEAWQKPEGLLVWDAVGLDAAALGERLSLEVKTAEGLSALGITRSPFASEAEGRRFAAAAALGLGGLQPGLLAIDFLHSRLAPKKKTARGRRGAWAAALAAALVAAGVLVLLDWRNDKADVAELKTRLEAMSEDIEAAAGVIEKVPLARAWYDSTPRLLDCLRELTLAFPAEGGIWTTNLAVREDMPGSVSGKSVDERTVLEVLDALKDRGTFADVKLLYMSEAGRGSREVSFAISFTFTGSE